MVLLFFGTRPGYRKRLTANAFQNTGTFQNTGQSVGIPYRYTPRAVELDRPASGAGHRHAHSGVNMGPIEILIDHLLAIKPIAFIGSSTGPVGSSTGPVGSTTTPGGIFPL